MDPTGCPPIEIQFSHDDLQSFNGSYASSDMPTLTEDVDYMDSLNGSLSPPGFDAQVHCLTDREFASAGANKKFTPSDQFAVVGNEEENRSPGSHDVIGLDGTSPYELQGLQNTSLCSDTENDCLSSSVASKETSKGIELDTIFSCSECELYGEIQSSVDELDKDLKGTSIVEDDWNSEKELDRSRRKRKEPVFSWKEPVVDKSEIPSSVYKPPISDITDLGDRFSHANLNATQLSTALDAPEDGKQHLTLQDRIFAELIRSHDRTKGFFPRPLLSTLITEDCVIRELTRTASEIYNPCQIRAHAKSICEERPLPRRQDDNKPPKIKSFKKIFAILVLIEKTSSIGKFLEEDVNDLDLPLSKYSELKNGPLFHLRRLHSQGKSLKCFQDWTRYQIAGFEEWQWSTIAPFFHKGLRKDVQHFPLQNSVVLPFLPPTDDDRRDEQNEHRTEIVGGFGCVFEARIHPDHHNFDLRKLQTQSFAIKRLYSKKREDFEKEVEMLKMFSDDTHAHLISLLATYEHLKDYYLIFPWADGDLTQFWEVHHPNPVSDVATIKWVAEQCKGIAHGLVKIHTYQTSNSVCPNGAHEHRYGRHGDLKPENILWFKDAKGGMLKISDFGLSEYSTIHNRSKTVSSVATSMSYRPPECDLKDGKVGPSYDIWTLGCLYLEFITWLLGGWNLVKEFEKKRMSFDPIWYCMSTDTFFELTVSQQPEAIVVARVKPAVTDFMQQLREHSSCTEFLHEFINMIRLDMMLVKSQNPGERRWSSDEVYRRIDEMLKKCESDIDYMCKPAPWFSTSQTSDKAVKVGTNSAAVLMLQRTVRQHGGSMQEQLQPKMLSATGRRPSFRPLS